MKKIVLMTLLLLSFVTPAATWQMFDATSDVDGTKKLFNSASPRDHQKKSLNSGDPQEADPQGTIQQSTNSLGLDTEQQGPSPITVPSRRVKDPPDALELLKLSINEMKRQDSLLTGYRYLKTVVIEHLNKDLSPKKSETRLFEVTSVPDGPDVEVLVAVDGKPVSEKEKQKSRSQQEKGEKKGDGQLELKSEELVTLFEWTIDGHELVNERPATILRFQPKPEVAYTGDDPKAEKFLRNVHGTAWVDDEEHVISRIEFKSMRPLRSFGGVLWTLHSFQVTEERKKLPEGVWIDSVGKYFVHATALVFKKIRTQSVMHTHDYTRPLSGEESIPTSSGEHSE